MIQFSLPLPPPSNNLFPGTMRRHPSKRYEAWRAEATPLVPRGRIDGCYIMRVGVDRPDRRKRDIANLEKALGDLVVSCGLVADDSLMDRLEMWWTKRPVGRGAMAHIWLSPVTEEVAL